MGMNNHRILIMIMIKTVREMEEPGRGWSEKTKNFQVGKRNNEQEEMERNYKASLRPTRPEQ